MIPAVKAKEVAQYLPRRAQDSHKGMNGRVMVVGGSVDYFGAPLLAAMGALYSGADLVYMFVPQCNFDVSRSHYPDFIVKKYEGDFLNTKVAKEIIEFSRKCDAILIGPGLGNRSETLQAVFDIVDGVNIPTVLDADAIEVIQKIKKFPLSQQIVITPHHNEFEHLTGKDIKIKSSLSAKVVLTRTLATDLKINILLKGPEDIISSEQGATVLNQTGNPGMTVGGTGDVLAGLVTSLIAQGTPPFEACKLGAFINGKAGDSLFKNKGYGFSASDLALELPYVMREYL